MSDKQPATEVASAPPDAKSHIPSDRDESPSAPVENAQHDHNRKSIAQAHSDVESGLQDTERYGTPSDVPSSSENER